MRVTLGVFQQTDGKQAVVVHHELRAGGGVPDAACKSGLIMASAVTAVASPDTIC